MKRLFLRPLSVLPCLGGALLGMLVPGLGFADHKIYSPRVEAGEWEVELRGHRDFDSADSLDGGQAHKGTLGYGLTDAWFTEIVVEYEKSPGSSGEVEAIEWENIFELADPDGSVGFGLYAEYAWARESGDPDDIVLGALVEKVFAHWTATANLFLEREIGSHASDDTGVDYALRARLPAGDEWAWGLEGYGARGGRQQAGPALYGDIRLGAESELEWRFGLLFGLDGDMPAQTLLWEFELGFE